MNFFKADYAEKNSKSKVAVNYKARLEKKLCLARENPEPVFDLSDCSLKHVPNNIFSLCRVFRKDALFLQENLLSSLTSGGPLDDLKNLKILNLSFNKFTKLPNEINLLSCLEVLDVSNNQIVELPLEIGNLLNLKCLNVSCNKLKSLPDSIGNCQLLEELMLTSNDKLQKLPISMGLLTKLKVLKLDLNIKYPPKDVCQNGVTHILKFLQGEFQDEFSVPLPSATNSEEKKYLKKVQEPASFKDVEKKLVDSNLMNMKIHGECQNLRLKLLNSIKNEQKALDEKLNKIQKQRSADQALLVQQCQKEEKESCEAVLRILKNNQKMKMSCFDFPEVIRKNEEDKLIEIALATKLTQPSQRHQILASMDETIQEEIKRHQTFNTEKRLCALKSLAAEIAFENLKLEKLIKRNDESKKHIMGIIMEDEVLQKSAVASLLEKGDFMSWQLSKRISIIQDKLQELTCLELMRKKIETDNHLTDISQNRVELTKILISLFEKQAKRREELIKKIKQLEIIRNQNQNENHFWLRQYDQLMHSKSNEMVQYLETLKPNLVYQLFMNGVFHYLPLLKDYALNEDGLRLLDIDALNKVGITSLQDQESILDAVKIFLKQESNFCEGTPSAPEFAEPTAPLGYLEDKNLDFSSGEECVVCLDLKPTVIFIPCGHICTCCKCSASLAACPLCRQMISEMRQTS